LRDQKFNGFEAAEKLGFHAAASAFAELMRLSKDRNAPARYSIRTLDG